MVGTGRPSCFAGTVASASLARLPRTRITHLHRWPATRVSARSTCRVQLSPLLLPLCS
jgi:hypothetical protein